MKTRVDTMKEHLCVCSDMLGQQNELDQLEQEQTPPGLAWNGGGGSGARGQRWDKPEEQAQPSFELVGLRWWVGRRSSVLASQDT